MFYTKEQFNDFITCQGCNTIFKDPRSLPCGECMCNNCIKNQTNEGNKQFNCSLCNEMHIVPLNDGFPVCRMMISFMNKEPDGEFKFRVFDEFQNQLKAMKDDLDSYTSKIDNSNSIINEHCEMVKNQIEIKVESIIQQIEKCKEELIQKVDAYETKCKSIVENKKEDFQRTIKETAQLATQYTDYTIKQRIDEIEIIEMKENLNTQRNILTNEIEQFEQIIFDGARVEFNSFESQIESSLIGTINFNFSKIINLECDTDDIKMLNLANNQFLIVENITNSKSRLNLFDKDFNLIGNGELAFSINSLCFNPKENTILCSFFHGKCYFIAVLDQSFNFLNKSYSPNFVSICADSEKVYCLTEYLLNVYILDSNLKFLSSVGQHESNLPFFIDPNVYSEIKVMNKKLIMISENKIRVIDAYTGLEVALIKEKSHQIIIDKDELHMIVYKEHRKYELQTYNSNFKLKSSYLINDTDNIEDCFFSIKDNKVKFIFNKKTFKVSF
jgi:hypothetical protein